MFFERNLIFLSVFVTKVFGDVSKEEAILGAATSEAVYGSNLIDIEQGSA